MADKTDEELQKQLLEIEHRHHYVDPTGQRMFNLDSWLRETLELFHSHTAKVVSAACKPLQEELTFYRTLKVETGTLQKRTVSAGTLYEVRQNEMQQRLAQLQEESKT